MSAEQADRLSALFEAHADRLYRLARRLVPSADDALDLVQDTFIKAARSPESIPAGLRDEEAWLVRVLVNDRRDQWRKEAVRKRHDFDVSHSLERLRLSPPIFKIGIGRTTRPAGADIYNAIIPVDRSGPFEEHRVRHCENRGIDPYANRQHRDGHRGEARILPELAQRIADVPQHIVNQSPAPRISSMLSHEQRAAQRPRRRRSMAGLPRLHVEVKTQFLVEIAIEGSLPRPCIKSAPQFPHASSLQFQHPFNGGGHAAELVAPSCFCRSRVTV